MMIDWKMVGVGSFISAALTIVLSLIFFPLFFLGPVIGGFSATYFNNTSNFSNMNETDGAVAGLLSGVISGLIIGLLFILGFGAISAIIGLISAYIGLIAGTITLILGVVITVFSIIVSAILGCIGGVIGVILKKTEYY